MSNGGLEVERLSLVRGPRAALSDVSFSLKPGALLAVVGPSGAGKSTLLSLLAGFEAPTSGGIRFGGVDWRALDPTARGVGVSFDDAALHEHLPVADNLDLAARPLGERAAQRRADVVELARSLGIDALLDRTPPTLSAGERRRVSLGRAFARRPALALLDEPFANLDRANRFAVRALIRKLQRTSAATTVMVTHDPTDALALADDLLVLVGGRLRAHGAASAVASRPIDLEVAQLVDDLGMESIALLDGHAPAGCTLEPGFATEVAERLARRGFREARLGLSPWRWSATPAAAETPPLVIEGAVAAREPAGAFTDLLVALGDGGTVRARVPTAEAQKLPRDARARLLAKREDIHLFGGPWPGVRVD